MSDMVQIDKKLFMDLVKYHVYGFVDEETEECFKQKLKDKLDTLLKRELYTKSKTAKTEEEREQARKEYLDLIGMKDSFRY